MAVNTYSFPSIAQSEEDKKKPEYYRKWVNAIVSNTFTDTWTTNYQVLKSIYEFYLVGTGSDLTNYLQTNPDGTHAPGIWTSLNSIKSRLKVLMGALEERGYVIKARALNNAAF